RRRFIDRLDRLKRQRHAQRRDAVARAVIFAFPNQFRPCDRERVLGPGCRLVAFCLACHVRSLSDQPDAGQAWHWVSCWKEENCAFGHKGGFWAIAGMSAVVRWVFGRDTADLPIMKRSGMTLLSATNFLWLRSV